jgi:hypothetical protein
MSEHSTAGSPERSLPSPLARLRSAQTYRNLAYLLVRFPLGIAYLTVFVTGITVGVVLVPFGVGVVVLAAVLGAAEHAGALEAMLLERLLGRRVAFERTDPNELPVWPYLKTVGTERRNYALVAYCLASFALGIAVFVVVVTGTVLSVALAVAPLVYWLPGAKYDFGQVDVGGVSLGPVDTFPEAALASVVGLALGVVWLYVFDATARGVGGVTARVLED